MSCQTTTDGAAKGTEFFACGAGAGAGALELAMASGFIIAILIVGALFYCRPKFKRWGLPVLFVLLCGAFVMLHSAVKGDAFLIGALCALFWAGTYFHNKFDVKAAWHALWRTQSPNNVSLEDFLCFLDDLAIDPKILTEHIRLSELRIAEMRESIVAFRSNFYFIIAGAASIAAFFLSEKWCFENNAEFLRAAGVILCLAAGVLSGLMLIGDDVGLAGVKPEDMHKIRRYIIRKNLQDVDSAMHFHLRVLLMHYAKSIHESKSNLDRKQHKFSLIAFILFMGITASVLWVAVKLFQNYVIAPC